MANFKRSQKGNMLLLASVSMSLIAIFILMACSFGSVIFMHNRLQTAADEIALCGARKLNENDRIGQFNNMIARNRQLVYVGNDVLESIDADYPLLHNLASQLYLESKASSHTLETDRHALVGQAISEAETAMNDKFTEIKDTYSMSLPWLKVSTPSIMPGTMKVGKIDQVQSNVAELTGVSGMSTADHGAGHVINSPGLNLYKEHNNARLTTVDGSLDYKFCSLPAPVTVSDSVIIAPARIVLANKFRDVDTSDELPSACRVQLELTVSTGLGTHAQSDTMVTGTAAATGANIQL
jgi:hypothetical protein